jgi:hypothetical protein
MSLRRTYQTIRSVLFSDRVAPITGTGLDSQCTLNRFPSANSDGWECSRRTEHDPKTIVVLVVVVGVVPVAICRPTIRRIVVPGTAAQQL